MASLALELQSRGHTITWVGLLDGAERAVKRGFRSVIIGREEFPLGYSDEILAELGRKSGLAGVRYALELYRRGTEVGLREGPKLIGDSGATMLLADESMFSLRTVAELVGIPWVSICSALPFHPEPNLPPSGVGWGYGTSPFHRLRNSMGYSFFSFMMGSIMKTIHQFRDAHQLPRYDMYGNASTLATFAQISEEFDFPRTQKPDWFHYVGSLQRTEHRVEVPFPWEQLDHRPLIYASMGTVQNRLLPIFTKIAQACAEEQAQLVVSLGGGAELTEVGSLPSSPIVVEGCSLRFVLGGGLVAAGGREVLGSITPELVVGGGFADVVGD